jgi:hypothetical protein
VWLRARERDDPMTAGQLSILGPLTEQEWQRQVTDLAELCGWHWAHWRAARTEHGWRTPVSGTIGAGFVDLILVHPRRRRALLIELKSDIGRLSDEQRDVHEVLRQAGLEVDVWRPRDWERVVAALHTPAAVRQEPSGIGRQPPTAAGINLTRRRSPSESYGSNGGSATSANRKEMTRGH